MVPCEPRCQSGISLRNQNEAWVSLTFSWQFMHRDSISSTTFCSSSSSCTPLDPFVIGAGATFSAFWPMVSNSSGMVILCVCEAATYAICIG